MVVAAVFTVFSAAQAQVDDFADADDSEWIRYDPFLIAGAGSVVTFDTTGGSYRLACPPSPVPAVGPARGASFRPDQYTDFCISVDVPVYDGGLEQAFGILARVQSGPAPGAVFGYAMTYHPIDDDIQITRLDNEQIIEISPYEFLWEPPESGVLRLVFMGKGGKLVGRAYDAANPVIALAQTVVTNDTTYSSGMCGIAVIDNTETGDQAADATFDNYHAGTGEPGPLRIRKGSGGNLILDWDFPFYEHDLDRSGSIDPWIGVPVVGSLPTYSNGTLSITTSVLEGGRMSFFRLFRAPLP